MIFNVELFREYAKVQSQDDYDIGKAMQFLVSHIIAARSFREMLGYCNTKVTVGYESYRVLLMSTHVSLTNNLQATIFNTPLEIDASLAWCVTVS